MRRTKWSYGDEGLFGIEQAGDAMNLRCVNCFVEGERRNDSRDAFCQHRLARARRTDHQHVVTASDGHFYRALYVALPLHVAEINIVTLMRSEKFAQISARGKHGNFAAQKRKCLA